MDETSLHHQKSLLRQEMKHQLKQLSAEYRAEQSEKVCQNLTQFLSERPRLTVIAGYFPLPEEVNILPFLHQQHRAAKTILLPVMGKASLSFHQVENWDMLKSNQFHILEPVGTSSLAFSSIDVMIVPGLAFDITGGRVGRGRGYYDEILSQLSKHTVTIGVGFDTQVINHVPQESHDQKLQWMCTSQGVRATQSLK